VTGPTGPTGATGPSVNLTGPITSVGAATSIASQTGTGTTFAMSVSPTFTGTPVVPSAFAGTNTTQAANTAFVQSAIGFYDTAYTSLEYYSSPVDSTTTASVTANYQYYVPFYVAQYGTFDRIGIRTASTFTGGTVSVRLGIYNNSAYLPTTVLLDGGTVSCASANTTYTVTISQTLGAGWYWLSAAFSSVGGGTPAYNSSAAFSSIANNGVTSFGTTLTSPTTRYRFRQDTASSNAALATATPNATATTSPLIGLRRA
jgi:hypothetical protein